jgi:hypothetical protein
MGNTKMLGIIHVFLKKDGWKARGPPPKKKEMKVLQKEITGTQTSFSTNFGGKLSFILCFLFPERLHYC